MHVREASQVTSGSNLRAHVQNLLLGRNRSNTGLVDSGGKLVVLCGGRARKLGQPTNVGSRFFRAYIGGGAELSNILSKVSYRVAGDVQLTGNGPDIGQSIELLGDIGAQVNELLF